MLTLPPLTSAESKALNRTFSSLGIGASPLVHVLRTWQSSHITTTALLYYDFLLTLPLEAERFWTGRRSWASIFFYLNRYTAILFHIPVIYELFYLMPESVSPQNSYVDPILNIVLVEVSSK